MIIWRINKAKYGSTPKNAFSGQGCLYGDGRWHHQGNQIVYCANSAALAALEVLVHFDLSVAPNHLLFKAELPDDLDKEEFSVDDLPSNWRDIDPSPDQLKTMGDDFIARADSAVLVVPSVIIPEDQCILLNPLHPDFKMITLHNGKTFEFDPRLGVKS